MGFIKPFESYKKTKTKSGYDGDIRVDSDHDIIDLAFHISKTGIASLTASSINGLAISYTGEILVPNPKKE